MRNPVKCNVCGYITTQGKVKDVCPACGVLSTSFEPYVSKVSGKREALLSLHLHPIIVHFPMALVFLCLLFDIAALIFTGTINETLTTGVKLSAVLLPFGVLVAALAGMLDGKTRFKRLTTKKLRFKMMAALVFLAIAVTTALVALLVPPSPGALTVLLVLTCAAVVPAGLLGKTGSELICAVMPG